MPLVRARRETELGTEVQCSRCHEFWPEDQEFYFMQDGKAHTWCKACYRSDPKVVDKVERWKEKQRKNPAPPRRKQPLWSGTSSVFQPAIEVEEEEQVEP
jgi:hypothetical protein